MLERNKSLPVENKRLKIKLKAFQNHESTNQNLKYNYVNSEIDDKDVGNNIDDNQMDIDDPPQSHSPLIKGKSYSIISKYRILQELKNNKTSEIAKNIIFQYRLLKDGKKMRINIKNKY